MKFLSTIRLATGMLLLTAGLVLTVNADPGGPDPDRKHGHHGEGHRKGPPRPPGVHPGPPPGPPPAPRPVSRESREWQHDRGWRRHGGWEGADRWDHGRARHWHEEHRTWVQRGGYRGYVIERYSFGLYFGSGHVFRIHERPVIYRGYPRFYHEGYSFVLVDPWPEDWPEDWYETDDVYIVYDNGYYLYNRSHPGFGLAVTVVR